jgi:hypothetical protein
VFLQHSRLLPCDPIGEGPVEKKCFTTRSMTSIGTQFLAGISVQVPCSYRKTTMSVQSCAERSPLTIERYGGFLVPFMKLTHASGCFRLGLSASFNPAKPIKSVSCAGETRFAMVLGVNAARGRSSKACSSSAYDFVTISSRFQSSNVHSNVLSWPWPPDSPICTSIMRTITIR